MNSITMWDFKSTQYLLIAKAGLAVADSEETNMEILQTGILNEFKLAVAGAVLPEALHGLDRNIFLRTKSFWAASAKPGELHSGCSLWRKYGEIRRVVVNDLSAALEKLKVNGQPRSGLTLADLLEDVRVGTYSKKKAQNSKPIPTGWVPYEWGTFLAFGSPSADPEEAFCIV